MQLKRNCAVIFYSELLLNIPFLEESKKVEEVGSGE